jgi:drug/metabolite transporter (DMT)-like permease
MEPRKGYLTTEFYLALAAMIVSALLASGVFTEGDKAYAVLGFLGAALTSIGYSVSRGMVKKAPAVAVAPVVAVAPTPVAAPAARP